MNTFRGDCMSEKRFIRDGKYVFDTERETVLDIDLICILLNRFADENEQLRRECKSNEHLYEYYRQKYKKLLEDVQENVKGELVIR